MTREEAVKVLNRITVKNIEQKYNTAYEIGEALNMAIKSLEQETTIDMLLEIRKTDAEIINDLREKVETQDELIQKQNTLIEVQEQSIDIQKKVIEKQQVIIVALKEMCFEEM